MIQETNRADKQKSLASATEVSYLLTQAVAIFEGHGSRGFDIT